jgi:phage repressor protein C with HTH and peptisase S24 domain
MSSLKERMEAAWKRRLEIAAPGERVTKAGLARAAGVRPPSVQDWFSGETKTLKGQSMIGAAAYLRVNASWLESGKGHMGPPTSPLPSFGLGKTSTALQALSLVTSPPKEGMPTDPEPEYAGPLPFVRRVPVVGAAKLGENGWYEEVSSIPGAGDGHVEVFTKDPNAYALVVRGDSMHPAIRDGWLVVVEPNGAPAAGEYVLVKLRDGRSMVKELLYQRRDSIAVISVNGNQRITLAADEVESLQAVGPIVPPSKWRPD